MALLIENSTGTVIPSKSDPIYILMLLLCKLYRADVCGKAESQWGAIADGVQAIVNSFLMVCESRDRITYLPLKCENK